MRTLLNFQFQGRPFKHLNWHSHTKALSAHFNWRSCYCCLIKVQYCYYSEGPNEYNFLLSLTKVLFFSSQDQCENTDEKKVLKTSLGQQRYSRVVRDQVCCGNWMLKWVAKPTLTLLGKSMCLFICGHSLKQAVKVCLAVRAVRTCYSLQQVGWYRYSHWHKGGCYLYVN